MLLIDQEATLGAIPELLPSNVQVRRKAFAALCEILSARGEVTGEARHRLDRVAQLFGSRRSQTATEGDEKVAKAS
jgi:hypothetical protein